MYYLHLNGTTPRKPTCAYVHTNILPDHLLPTHRFTLIFCFTQAFSSTPPSSLVLLLCTGLPRRPFSPCPSAIPWAPTSSPAGLAADSGGELLLLQAVTASLCLPCPSSRSPARCTVTWPAFGSRRRGEDEYNCLPGKGIHSPALLTPEPAKGTKDPMEKMGSQRITSAAGVEAGLSYLLIPIHQFPHKFTHRSSLFLISPSTHPHSHSPITSVISLKCLFQRTSGTHLCSSINSSLICSICFSPASSTVLRDCVSFFSSTFSQ